MNVPVSSKHAQLGFAGCTCQQLVATLGPDPLCNWDAAAESIPHSYKQGTSWGYTSFMPLKKVLDKTKGFLKDDKLEFLLCFPKH